MTDFVYSPYFSDKELRCKCQKCERAYVHRDLLKKITEARKRAKVPFGVTSGCRCPEHNAQVRGSANSDHLADGIDFICCGIDVSCVDDSTRFTIVKALFEVGINRIGLDKKFIHMGIDYRNAGNVLWLY